MLLVSGFVVDIPNVGLGQESPDVACAFIPLRREVFHENVAFVCGRISMQPLFFPKVDGWIVSPRGTEYALVFGMSRGIQWPFLTFNLSG